MRRVNFLQPNREKRLLTYSYCDYPFSADLSQEHGSLPR